MRFVIQIGASVIVIFIFVSFVWFAKITNWPTWLTYGALFILFILATGLITALSLALQNKKREDEDEED